MAKAPVFVPTPKLPPFKPTVSDLGDFLNFMHALIQRDQGGFQFSQLAGVPAQFIGDCYKLLVDTQREYLFQMDAEGNVSLRKSMEGILAKRGFTWEYKDQFSTLHHKDGKRITAFIPPQ